MKILNIYFLVVLAILAVSCEDKLEIEPRQSISGDLAVSSESSIENILVGVYDEAGQAPSYGGQLQMLADLLGAGDVSAWGGTFLAPREVKNKNILPDNGFVTHFGSGSMGVPLRLDGILDYSVDLSIARTDLASVYAQIISDLTDAVSLMPDTNDFFADKYSAQAILARVYLQQGNFAGARDAAHDVIMNSGHTLMPSYAAAFNHDNDEAEDVFAFQVTSQTGTNRLISHYASEENGGRGGDISVNQAFIDLFDDPADVRANFFYTSPQTGGRLTLKYTNQFGNLILVRLAEMHLIRAEGNFESSSTIGMSPLADLNAVRARSTGTMLTGPVTKAMILNERILELSFEGFSIHDVVRTQGSVDGFAYNANELTFPIPQSELDTNPLMEQNPGY